MMIKNTFSDIVIKPITTEKTTFLKENSNYVFKVTKNANKVLIKKVLEEYFSVKIKKINIINVNSKVKERVGRTKKKGIVPGYKKAYVTIANKDKLSVLDA